MKEFKLIDKVVFNPEGINWVSESNMKEFIRLVIEEDLEMCKVCDGSHGKWLDKDDFIKRFKKRTGDLK